MDLLKKNYVCNNCNNLNLKPCVCKSFPVEDNSHLSWSSGWRSVRLHWCPLSGPRWALGPLVKTIWWESRWESTWRGSCQSFVAGPPSDYCRWPPEARWGCSVLSCHIHTGTGTSCIWNENDCKETARASGTFSFNHVPTSLLQGKTWIWYFPNSEGEHPSTWINCRTSRQRAAAHLKNKAVVDIRSLAETLSRTGIKGLKLWQLKLPEVVKTWLVSVSVVAREQLTDLYVKWAASRCEANATAFVLISDEED